MTDDEIAIDITVRLNTVIMALYQARDITPERNPFREIDRALSDAISFAIVARSRCGEIKP
jgi:hypothetical protein